MCMANPKITTKNNLKNSFRIIKEIKMLHRKILNGKESNEKEQRNKKT